jgi:hypothetical protein
VTDVSADYFRRDQDGGITAPDLAKDCTFAEHIVRARGKRTQLSSVALEPERIRDFGPVLYRALSAEMLADGHSLVEHAALLSALRATATSATKEERARAIQTQRYARRRTEGLVQWSFDTAAVERKDLISWAFGKVQKYFTKA